MEKGTDILARGWAEIEGKGIFRTNREPSAAFTFPRLVTPS